MKFGSWFGTQPPCKHSSPVGQVPLLPQEDTQWFCEQTVPLGQAFGFDSHGVGFPLQTPELEASSKLVHA